MAAQSEIQNPGSRREDFDGIETTALVETASSAVAAQAKAAVQARYVLAMQRPRNLDTVRDRLLKDCRRPRFADSAIYHKPVGEGIEGASIRFAEAAMRCMGNIMPEVSTIYDDNQKRIVRVSVTDLEVNLTYSKDVVIQKTMERKNPRGETPISSRRNSKGDIVYLIPATDDDILNRENALISKAIRTNALRLLPGDIYDECMELCYATIADKAAKDPEAERKKVLDTFSSLGVPPEQVQLYLGHDLAICSPAEITKLRGIAMAIKDGEATWAEVMDTVAGDTDAEPDELAAKQSALAEKLAAVRSKREAAKTGEASQQSETKSDAAPAKSNQPSGQKTAPPATPSLPAVLIEAVGKRIGAEKPQAPIKYRRDIYEALEEMHGPLADLSGDQLAAAVKDAASIKPGRNGGAQ